MKNTFKSHGKTYQIKETGTKEKHVPEHHDLNGYHQPAQTRTIIQRGVFDGDTQVGKVQGNGDIIINGSKEGKLF